ncbi:hypothetical protein SLEP1_g55927 [Rubroshorea leprosula]|uniref:Uncharacterized protein n=1 Tax=Rubroshorea leprosula TaxID=152421 RepID=A0AAV5MKS4_9ROSI|nr:hypothetical protein SLEP1_g55927 [Rubroshorea leprosula]
MSLSVIALVAMSSSLCCIFAPGHSGTCNGAAAEGLFQS